MKNIKCIGAIPNMSPKLGWKCPMNEGQLTTLLL